MKTLLLYLEHIFVFINGLIEKLTGTQKKAQILSYLSYRNETQTRVLGRVVEKISRTEFSKDQRHLAHFIKVFKLFLTKKIAGANIQVDDFKITANEEGFFSEVIPTPLSNKAEIRLLSTGETDIKMKKVDYTIPIISPSEETNKIIISDIDDTVIKSKAVSVKSLVIKTLFSPLKNRVAFTEAAEFYQRLEKGPDKDQRNLFFYVSSSTWNLYPLLSAFMKENSFPRGPLLLQDIATEKKKNHSGSHMHKFDRISEIINFYPDYKYILIGDAGQADAKIYLKVAEEYPDQIQLILIRHTWWTKEIVIPDEYIEKAKQLKIPFVYFEDLTELDAMTMKILEN